MSKKAFLSAISALLCFVLCCLSVSSASGIEPVKSVAEQKDTSSPLTLPINSLCYAFNQFNSLIRDGLINKTAARSELTDKLGEIGKEYYRIGGKNYSPNEWVFPLAGYDYHAIDKGGNHGFVPGGYDFFSGNRHGGHPSYDIFIRDRNHDSLDDKSGKAVQVLSMTGGIVVALEKGWQQGSRLRGGNYLWVYDPANNMLVYYAHNGELLVDLGTIVKPGDPLATVGRSGLNAAKRRSPTHLHLSVLLINGGQPTPLKVYRDLQRARSVPVEVPNKKAP